MIIGLYRKFNKGKLCNMLMRCAFAALWLLLPFSYGNINIKVNINIINNKTKSTSANETYIQGATAVENGEFPFIVYVTVMYSVKPKQRMVMGCTGALLSASWVLTAARCVAYRKDDSFVLCSADKVRVSAGNLDRETCYPHKWLFGDGADEAKNGRRGCESLQIRKVDILKFNETFRDTPEPNEYDIGFIKVSKPFDLEKPDIETITLSAGPWPDAEPLKVRCTAIGFGKLENSTRAAELQKANVMAGMGGAACPCERGNRTTPLDTSSADLLVCLQHEIETADECQSDDGGLLVCEGSAVGIALAHLANGSCSMQTSCGVDSNIYVYITHFLDWLRDNDVEFVLKERDGKESSSSRPIKSRRRPKFNHSPALLLQHTSHGLVIVATLIVLPILYILGGIG